jgi:hypothetical protein
MADTKSGLKVVITKDSPYLGSGHEPLLKQFLGVHQKGEFATPRQGQADPEPGPGPCSNQPFDRTQASLEFRDQHPAGSEERRRTAWEA